MRAATIYQKSNNSDSSLSARILRYGGAALVVGGLGFLWYRNSSLKVYNEMGDEEFCKLHFKIENNLFPEIYSISRVHYAKTLASLRNQNPNRIINFMDPMAQGEISKAIKSVTPIKLPPLTGQELKHSKFPKLSLRHYYQKEQAYDREMFNKLDNQRVVPLTDLDRYYSNTSILFETMQVGFFVQAFQNVQIDNTTSRLDHRDCLKRLVEYELETIKRYNTLYKKLIVKEGCLDLKKREQELEKIIAERAKMEPLEVYARERLGGEAGGDQGEVDQLRYHPLILFLLKAFIPDPEVQYSRQDIIVLIQLYLMEFEVMVYYSFTYLGGKGSIDGLKNIFDIFRNKPAMKQVIEKIGLEVEFPN